MPSARRSISAQVMRLSPCTRAVDFGTWSATVSQTSAKFQSVTAGAYASRSWTLPFPETTIRHESRCASGLAQNPQPCAKRARRGPGTWHRTGRGRGDSTPDPIDQLVIDEELRAAGVRRPFNPIGIGWAGPTLLHAGTSEQIVRYLPPLLSGEEVWCQLFSEPGAGSDLAGLSTRATSDGDGWVVSGQKVWTTYAHLAQFGILLARTDPSAPSTQASRTSSARWTLPGVTIRPIVDMTGDHAFNEVFLDDVHLGPEHLVGRAGTGLVARQGHARNERVSLSGEGALWGQGPTAERSGRRGQASGGVTDAVCASVSLLCGPRARCCGSSASARSVRCSPDGSRGPRPRSARPWPTITGSR